MLGQNAAPAILSVNTFTSYTSSDYNGFRVNPGAKSAFEWTAPPAGVVSDFTGPGHEAARQTQRFTTLADYAAATGQDRHSVAVDYDVFVNVRRLDAQDTATVQKLTRGTSSLQAQAGICCRRSWCAAGNCDRRIRGTRSGSGCAGSRAGGAAVWAQKIERSTVAPCSSDGRVEGGRTAGCERGA